jgi:phospholipase/lecithinase/hemolysin
MTKVIAARALTVVLAGLLATACATAPQEPPRLVSFGDSLSDLGTYAAATDGRTAAKWTTNPGPVWIEVVAAGMGTTIKANRHAGWGKPTAVLGGMGYAEGGSQVTHDDPRNVNATAPHGTSLPVHEQVSAHLAANGGRFGPRDVVFVWAGANDMFRIAPGTSVQAGEEVVRQAAKDLVGEVRRMLAAGASRVVVLTLDDYGEVPALVKNPRHGVLTGWVNGFNAELASGLTGLPVLLVDANATFRAARSDPARFGLKNSAAPACDMTKLPNRSVMLCDEKTLVEKDAQLTYLYADGLHPSTAGHRLIANEVLKRLKASAK